MKLNTSFTNVNLVDLHTSVDNAGSKGISFYPDQRTEDGLFSKICYE